MASEYAVQCKNCAGWYTDSVYTSLAKAKRQAREIGQDFGPMWIRQPVRILTREVSEWKMLDWRIKNGK